MEETECSETSAYKIQTPGKCRMTTFKKTVILHVSAYKDGTYRVLRNVGI